MKDVLLIDDDNIFIFLGKKMLNHIGSVGKIYSAPNGQEALQLIQNLERAPDIILLDLNMPVMDGFEFLNACRGGAIDPALTRICVVSSSHNPKDITHATELGAEKFILKPLQEDSLRSYIG